MSEPHPGAIAGISSEQFAENARAIGEAVGSTADESAWRVIPESTRYKPIGEVIGPVLADKAAWLVLDRFTFAPDPEKPGFTIE